MLLLGIFALVALVTPAAAGVNWNKVGADKWRCGQKNGNAVQAIEGFCSKNFFVGSGWASDGVKQGDIWVFINRTCNKTPFLPREWCVAQMYEVCAAGDGKGRNRKKYAGCQQFVITRP